MDPRISQTPLSRLDADLAQMNAIAVKLQEQRISLVAQAVAVRIAQSVPHAESYTVQIRDGEPVGWELDLITGHDGAAADPDDALVADVNTILRDHPPGAATITRGSHPGQILQGRRFPIPAHDSEIRSFRLSVIDIDTLTEDDFTQAYRAAEDRLDLVGVVRTRGDFEAQFREELQLRPEVTDNVIGVAVDVALHRYRNTIEESPRIADIEAEAFHEVIGDVARFLDLEQDDHDAHLATEHTIALHPDRNMRL
ncbi:MAG: hypothetical protein ACK5MT_03865 [Actinomycetales bacterium]